MLKLVEASVIRVLLTLIFILAAAISKWTLWSYELLRRPYQRPH